MNTTTKTAIGSHICPFISTSLFVNLPLYPIGGHAVESLPPDRLFL
jgi:hypothetical protein